MSYGLGKKDNEYSRFVCDIDASKTVWMALAVSLAFRVAGEGAWESVELLLMDEWQKLHENGIVPQKPRKSA